MGLSILRNPALLLDKSEAKSQIYAKIEKGDELSPVERAVISNGYLKKNMSSFLNAKEEQSFKLYSGASEGLSILLSLLAPYTAIQFYLSLYNPS
mmetsp:Transcript_13192/g.22369  ORF Transcript_13192/g.22369 Transcript_13192/m.22369 type:complete len:95 (+) Transcript_13192:238-522(+)